MSEYVRLPPLPDSGNDVLRSMTVIPYLDDMYHGSDDDDYDPRDPDEIDEHVLAVTEGNASFVHTRKQTALDQELRLGQPLLTSSLLTHMLAQFMTLTFNPWQAMVMTHTPTKSQKIQWKWMDMTHD